jgi:hypothetical protein
MPTCEAVSYGAGSRPPRHAGASTRRVKDDESVFSVVTRALIEVRCSGAADAAYRNDAGN